MRNKIGNLFMLLGAALVFAALLLLQHNQREAQEAEYAAVNLLPEVIAEIEVRNERLTAEGAAIVSPAITPADGTEVASPAITPADGTLQPVATAQPDVTPAPTLYVNPYDSEMTVVEISGSGYIGYVSIPELSLELPVMSEWSYPKLRKAPCRYSGSTKTDDLVILAHNYSRHFGKISKLSIGDEVIFTDMNGVVTHYSVVETDTLSPYAVEEMTAGDYDLTLFTCTYGGKSRITVRCDRAE